MGFGFEDKIILFEINSHKSGGRRKSGPRDGDALTAQQASVILDLVWISISCAKRSRLN